MLRRISEGPIGSAITFGATEAATKLGIGVSFAIPASEAALARVTNHLELLGAGIENTTVADVRRVLTDSLRAGVSNAETRKALDTLFDGYADWRLDRISPTETTAAYNLGAIGQYRDAGVQLVEVSDGDVDEPCAAANGALWTLEQAEANPISHPNCTRTWVPDTSSFGATKVPDPLTSGRKTEEDMHVHFHLPESLSAQIRSEPPVINVAPPEVTIEAPVVNVAPPIVNVTPPPVTVKVAPPDVKPFTDALREIRTDLATLKAQTRPRSRELVRDELGRIIGSRDVEDQA